MQTHADKQVSRGTEEGVEKTYPKSGKGMLHLVKRSNYCPLGKWGNRHCVTTAAASPHGAHSGKGNRQEQGVG